MSTRSDHEDDADEKGLPESVQLGEWKPAAGGKRERTRYARYAKATFRKDRRLNIRLSSKDLEAIQKRALAEGLPYQTLIEPAPQIRVRAAQGGVTILSVRDLKDQSVSRHTLTQDL